MDQVTVAGFRCFHSRQTARLAPLTLLVGANSTGKTSFLALVRLLWDIAFRERIPDINAPDYDLGTFDEIAHDHSGRGGKSHSFEAGFSIRLTPCRSALDGGSKHMRSHFEFKFRRGNSGVFPHIRRIEADNALVECRISEQDFLSLAVATSSGSWILTSDQLGTADRFGLSTKWDSSQRDLISLNHLLHTFKTVARMDRKRIECIDGTAHWPTSEDLDELSRLLTPRLAHVGSLFAYAPMRSQPRRTYDPAHAEIDSEGENIPMFLANVALKESSTWHVLKEKIEGFGQAAGLYDEITIRVLDGKKGGPFQVQVRKLGTPPKGPRRNIIDVGSGVSQVLPLVSELLRPNGPRMILLQQPQVHLHPSAQAALGSLLCEVASPRRQLIVETHSDHLIDRVRMDVRDGTTKLKPREVSILYFEYDNRSVSIHSLGWDSNGNLISKRGPIPVGYRRFFRNERRRSIGL